MQQPSSADMDRARGAMLKLFEQALQDRAEALARAEENRQEKRADTGGGKGSALLRRSEEISNDGTHQTSSS